MVWVVSLAVIEILKFLGFAVEESLVTVSAVSPEK